MPTANVTHTGPTTFQSGIIFDSSTLTDAQATRMGLKQYLHGTTYNGGIAPTLTCPQAGFSVTRAVFIPYQVQDGTWRVRFNFRTSFTSASITGISITVNGVTWKNIAGLNQNYVANWLGLVNNPRGYVSPNESILYFDIPSAVTTSGAMGSGDIELESKPTWAY